MFRGKGVVLGEGDVIGDRGEGILGEGMNVGQRESVGEIAGTSGVCMRRESTGICTTAATTTTTHDNVVVAAPTTTSHVFGAATTYTTHDNVVVDAPTCDTD